MIAAGALIVIDTDTSPRSIPANSVCMSSSVSTATPSRPDLAERAGVVGVVAHQRGHVEGGREPRLAVLEQVVEALVGLLAGAEAGELAHRPQPPAVHRVVDAARERVLAGTADRVLGAAAAGARGRSCGRVELADGLARERAEVASPEAPRGSAGGLVLIAMAHQCYPSR